MLATIGSTERRQTSNRFVLRDATADLHAKIDLSLSGPFDSDSAAYGRFLQSLAIGVLPLERALEEAGIERLVPDWERRRRGDALKHDLETLGIAVPSGRQPSAGDEAWLFGALYVLEGSRLGGKVLLRRVLQNPDPKTREATHYLRQGEGLDLWPSFLAQLERSTAVTRSPNEAIAGARAAFTLFERAAARA